MGTSITHRSPRTMAWSSVQLGYEHAVVPEARVLRDVWRAALAEPQANWSTLLGSAAVAGCLEIAMTSSSPGEGLSRASRLIAAAGEGSLASEVAKRAVVASSAKADPAREYVAKVFAAATDYLVSRDLAGHIGRGDRLTSVRDAMAFKERLKNQAASTAREVAGSNVSTGNWTEMASTVARALAKT